MKEWIAMLNVTAVTLFGSVLSASFSGALDTRRNRCIFCFCMVLIPILQGGAYSIWDAELLWYVYPFIMHLPLLLALWLLTGKVLWPLIAILTAYFLCQLRRWIALLAVALFHGGDMMQDIVELIITLPLLLLLLRFLTPAVRQLSVQRSALRWQFGLMPAVYYIFDYGARIYTDLLYNGTPVVVEFMPFVCVMAYMVFLLYFSSGERKRIYLEQTQKSLDIQMAQSVREIRALRESESLARQYRHDLRHHLQYVSACIGNGQPERAQAYISDIFEEIDTQKVQQYCENEVANLIFSEFVGRAKKSGICMEVHGSIPASIAVADSDLCVILSNALENAIHACQPLAAEEKPCTIDVQFFERGDKFFLQVSNPCEGDVRFQDGIPVTDKPGHGIGVASICAIVRRYSGVYDFLVRDGQFILRLSL